MNGIRVVKKVHAARDSGFAHAQRHLCVAECFSEMCNHRHLRLGFEISLQLRNEGAHQHIVDPGLSGDHRGTDCIEAVEAVDLRGGRCLGRGDRELRRVFPELFACKMGVERVLVESRKLVQLFGFAPLTERLMGASQPIEGL